MRSIYIYIYDISSLRVKVGSLQLQQIIVTTRSIFFPPWKLARSSAAKLINYCEEKCFTLRFSIYVTLFRKVAQNLLAIKPVRVISSSQRPLPDNTQHSQQTDIRAPGGIRTHSLSRRAACRPRP